MLISAFVVYLAFVGYLFFGFSRLLRQQNNTAFPFITIIVSARNESQNIESCIDALLTQMYPKQLLQIIIVNDQSTDTTELVLKKYQRSPQVSVLNNVVPKKYKSSKKSALETAIFSAHGEILLFTDADCLPPREWAKAMVGCFQQRTGLVAGFSPQTATHPVWNDLLICDSLAAAFVAAGTMGFGHGVTCTGRNLAYKKQAFEKIGGFQRTPDSLSGDDDFVLQQMAELPNWHITYAVDPNAVVPSKGPKNLRAFLKQKRRHISAGKHFSLRQQMGYGLYHLTNVFLWLTPLIDLMCGTQLWLGLAAKIFLDILALSYFAAKFQFKPALPHILLWEIFFVIYNSFFAFTAFTAPKSWK